MFVQLQVANVLCAGRVFDEEVEEMNEHIGRGYGIGYIATMGAF
jgi:hypothetical protein